MSRDVMAEIKDEVLNSKIMLYMKGTPDLPRCGFSMAVVRILNDIGRPYSAVNVLEDPEKWNAVKVFSSWPTIPQLYIEGEFVGGCDIAREMYSKGELQAAVEKAFSGAATSA